jgi:hypothetical protein
MITKFLEKVFKLQLKCKDKHPSTMLRKKGARLSMPKLFKNTGILCSNCKKKDCNIDFSLSLKYRGGIWSKFVVIFSRKSPITI